MGVGQVDWSGGELSSKGVRHLGCIHIGPAVRKPFAILFVVRSRFRRFTDSVGKLRSQKGVGRIWSEEKICNEIAVVGSRSAVRFGSINKKVCLQNLTSKIKATISDHEVSEAIRRVR